MKYSDGNHKRALIICGTILLLGMLVSCSKASPTVINPPVASIRVVMDNNYPPYIFLDEQGNAQGILVDQWALWEKHTGVKVELSAVPWDDALSDMEAGKYDVIDTIFYTDERAKIYDFTDSYARIDVPIFFHNNISAIADAGDLKGFRVAVKSGDADAEYLTDAGITGLVYYNSYEEIIQAAERKEETIFVIDQPPGLYFLYKYGLQNQFNYSAPLFSGDFHRAVKKGEPALLDLVVSGFASISKSEYQAIDNRWFGIQQGNNWQKYLPYLLAGSLIFLIIILTLIVFNRTLQKRVSQQTQELKQALSSLQKSERKYREIFNATTEAIFIHAIPSGQLIHVNEPMLKMYGYATEQEVLSKSADDLNSNEPHYSWLDAQEKIHKVFEEGPQVFEWLAQKKTGELFWTEVSLRHSTIGGESQVLAVIRDITKRKQAEEALRESESLLREAQVIADMGNYVLDFTTGMWKSSASLDKLFGIDDAYTHSVEGWSDLIHPEHRQQMIDYFTNEVMGKRTRFDKEYKIIRKNDGIERWVHGLGELEIDAQNRLVKMHGVVQDITERKQAETALQISELQLKANLDNTPNVGVQWYNDKGEVIYWNKASEDVYGYTSEEAMGKTLDKLIHTPEENAEFLRIVKEISSTGNAYGPYEAKTRNRNGQEGWVLATTFTMPMGDDNIGIVCMDVDITERKQAEEAIKQRLAEQSILHQASQALLAAHLDPETIYLTLHQAVVQIMPCEAFTIVLADKSGGDYQAVYLYDTGHRYPARRIPRGEGLSGKVIPNGETLFIHDNQQSNVPAVHFGEPQSVRSILAVPLRQNNETIGMVSAQSYQPNVYGERHRVLLETLAAQITTVIENAHLFEAERKQRQVSDALRDALSAGASMSTSLDFEAILDRLLEALERVIPFEGGSIMLVQAEQQKIRIARVCGYKKLDEEVVEAIINYSFDIATVENLRWMLENKQPLVITNIDQYPGWIRTQGTDFIRSWAGAPIIVNNEVIALFSLDSTEPNFFTNEHIELMRSFTGQASLALQNARLFEETERRFKEFAALYETSNALSAENELNTMLQVIVEHAKKLLDAASSGMYFYLSETDELELTVDTTPYIPLGTRLKLIEGIAGRVAQTHQPLRIDDYSTWEGRLPVYDGTVMRAVLEVPMLYGGELIGVLTAEEIGDSKRKFTEADERLLSLFASQAAGAIHSARLREQTARRLDQLQALHVIDRAISSSFDLRPILNTVITQTIAQLGVDAVDVLLFHPHLQTLEYIAGQGFRTRAIEQTHLRLGECFAGQSAFERRIIHVPNLAEISTNFTRDALLKSENFLECYFVPLIAKGEIKGVLEVFHRASLPRDPEWLDFLETLAGQAAITIDQTQLFDNLQRANLELIIAYDATIEGWARAMDLRDKETENHTRRVTEMTLSLAKALGIKDNETLHIRRGALLHDIGKMGVPDNILLKEGELTEAEWILMRRHPQFAYEMIQPIKYLRQSLDIPYCHHEKWDGTGYPRGLKGEQIPLTARIFAIVDVWDALTSDRPYRKGWMKQKALNYIQEQSGKHFDPKVVDVFLEIFGSEES